MTFLFLWRIKVAGWHCVMCNLPHDKRPRLRCRRLIASCKFLNSAEGVNSIIFVLIDCVEAPAVRIHDVHENEAGGPACGHGRNHAAYRKYADGAPKQDTTKFGH